ncbi:MAG: chorismate synthase [Defluviitaleaceae bacterium]|nr:chorismate synthase [Defluviitaleaceae bacterium]
MSGSIFGQQFCLSTWGESHGPAIGAVVDGCPAGIPLSIDDIQKALDRRKPGTSPFATQRKEADHVEILSGIFEGRTTGTPISMLIRNTDQRSRDYDPDPYRPGHADYTYDLKYGFRDYCGGGRASARETATRVAGGAVAQKFLAELGVAIKAYTHAIGDVEISNADFSTQNALNMPDQVAYEQAAKLVESAIQSGDSLGGEIACQITGIPAGVGEPVFNRLEAVLSHGIMSIGGVKGIAFGAGFDAAKMKGSAHNDALFSENGIIKKKTNHAGGMYGGISDGSPVTFKVAVKPTPSISQTQQSVNRQRENITLNIRGRHDPLIVPRAVVVVEAMAALAVADLILIGLSSNIDNIRKALIL